MYKIEICGCEELHLLRMFSSPQIQANSKQRAIVVSRSEGCG